MHRGPDASPGVGAAGGFAVAAAGVIVLGFFVSESMVAMIRLIVL